MRGYWERKRRGIGEEQRRKRRKGRDRRIGREEYSIR